MTKIKNARRQQSKQENEGTALFFAMAKCYAITLCIAGALLLALAYIAYSTHDPAAFVDTSAYLCLALSSLIGGAAAVPIAGRDRALSVSAMSGGAYVITLLLMALAADKINSPLYMLLGYGASVLFFVLGAIICIKLTKTKRRRRR